MTRLSAEQAAYLKEVATQRNRVDRLQERADSSRDNLNDMLKRGRELGISTHRLARAAGISQPRVQQITGTYQETP